LHDRGERVCLLKKENRGMESSKNSGGDPLPETFRNGRMRRERDFERIPVSRTRTFCSFLTGRFRKKRISHGQVLIILNSRMIKKLKGQIP
jgi:hypothetical protein